MGDVRVELNLPGFIQLLDSPEMRDGLTESAQRIAAAAGPGMEVGEVHIGRRARISVHTETAAAKRAEAQDRVLTRAIDAGRI